MASFSIHLRRPFCRWPYHLSFKNLGLCPDMTMTSETLSDKGRAVHSVFQIICIYLHEVLRKLIHQCRRVKELLNVKCVRKTVVVMGTSKNRTVAVNDYSEHSIWYSEIKMATICTKTQTKVMIPSDQLAVAGALLSDWHECQAEEQDEHHDGSDDETVWSEEEDEGISGMSSENRELWEYFLNSDPSNLFHISHPTADKNAFDHDTDSVGPCPQEKDETEWSEEEEDSDWSEEGDSEMSAESRQLWDSFNNNLYNPFCFSCPTGVPVKSFEVKQNLPPSSQTVSEIKDHQGAEQNTKERTKKVRFTEEVTMHYLKEWDFESQTARDGSCWMELARDRARFRRRVEEVGALINPCLSAQHRARVLDRLSMHSDGVSQLNGQTQPKQEDVGSYLVTFLWCLCVLLNLMFLHASLYV